jgi:Cu/Ag efflux protein CusF
MTAEGEKKMKTLVLVLALSVSGCAAYELQPLPLSHPANPLAMAAPERLPSKTLAYTSQDIPAVTVAATQQGNHDAHHTGSEADGQKTVVGEGKVVATVPNASQLVLEHGEIKGFMEPMTMGYKIEPPSLLDGLQSGDRVRFTIDVSRKTITKIEKMK